MAENKTKDLEKYDIETALKRLDEVADMMSREGTGLEEALALYEEGVALVRLCNKKLESAERKINALKMTVDGELEETPFDGVSDGRGE